MVTSREITSSVSTKSQQFLNEVIQGLKADPKFLSSKYFYDKTGDHLFQQIMHCPEYYLTNCELEILSQQAADIARVLREHAETFDLVELGAGDASKSIYLLQEFLSKKMVETYYPVDISSNVIALLEKELPEKLPELQMKGWNGEYINMLRQIDEQSEKRKVVLFLGSNIGNFKPEKALHFFRQLHQHLQPGDLLFTGFDLRKHPRIILDAYNDKQGFTKAFNLNLLTRINRELNANFELSLFDHYPTYDPGTGSCKSYLISLENQSVHLDEDQLIAFKKNETILMEVSHKYFLSETDKLAAESGFEVVAKFSDQKKWFADCLWKCKD